MTTDPGTEPTQRRVRSPRFVFLVCLAAAIVSSLVLQNPFTLAVAVALVVTAIVLQARGKNPAAWFAAGTGVAAGTLVYLLAVQLIGR